MRIEPRHPPLTDRAQRFPKPAGGLFSTAHDLARFYQMLLSGGRAPRVPRAGERSGERSDDRRLLSEAALKQMTSRQTPPELSESYGLGIAVGDHSFGHGGAFSTNTSADTKPGLILVWLVQHADFPGEGAKAQDAFRTAALDAFAAPRPAQPNP